LPFLGHYKKAGIKPYSLRDEVPYLPLEVVCFGKGWWHQLLREGSWWISDGEGNLKGLLPLILLLQLNRFPQRWTVLFPEVKLGNRDIQG
jgi:hypothetical protein